MRSFLVIVLLSPFISFAQQEPCFSINDVYNDISELNSTMERNFDEGWNMFGYPCTESVDVAIFFESITDKVIIVKDNLGLAYIPEYGFNGIGDLQQLEGYSIKLSESIFDFPFCENTVSLPQMEGCMDCNASNFSWWATSNDGSCLYDSTNVHICYHDSFIRENYMYGAQAHLVSEIYSDSTHENYTTIELDTNKVNRTLNILQSIYDLQIPETDSIFNYYGVNFFMDEIPGYIYIYFDTASVEIQNLVEGFPTGNTLLDSIINTYNFEVYYPFSFPSAPFLWMQSELPINVLPLIDLLSDLPFIINISTGGGMVGGGHSIEINENVGFSEVVFGIGWGDCPAGCIYGRSWVFSVDENCNAEFLYSYMD